MRLTPRNFLYSFLLTAGLFAGPVLAQDQATDQSADFFDSLDDLIPSQEGSAQEAPGQEGTADDGLAVPAATGEEQPAPDDQFGGELDALLSDEGAASVTVPEGLTVSLRGLDKVTGRTTQFDVPVEEPIVFGALTITMKYCEKAPPEEQPEVTAFLQIDAKDNLGEVARAFSGWMFASSPALSALEHPVYDVWVMDCKTVAPSNTAGAAAKEAEAASAPSN